MSFSFDIVAENAAQAKARVVTAMEDVARGQPAHEKDKQAAITVAHAYIDMLAVDPTHDIHVNMHGSVMYQYSPEYLANGGSTDEKPYFQVSVGVSAYHVPKKSDLEK